MVTPSKLTRRELQLLEMFRSGKTSKECAEELHLSYFTIETHRKNIHHKLGTHKLVNALNTFGNQSTKYKEACIAYPKND